MEGKGPAYLFLIGLSGSIILWVCWLAINHTIYVFRRNRVQKRRIRNDDWGKQVREGRRGVDSPAKAEHVPGPEA